MAEVHVLEHPLIQHKLAILRNKETSVKEFRELVGEIAGLMCYEATRKLPTEEVAVETPVGIAKCHVLAGKKLAIVPVLRAGLGMVDKMVDLIPSAKIGHIGLYRDPETHKPVEYYCKLPEDVANRQVFVVDPMLATGGSAVAAIDFLASIVQLSGNLISLLGARQLSAACAGWVFENLLAGGFRTQIAAHLSADGVVNLSGIAQQYAGFLPESFRA